MMNRSVMDRQMFKKGGSVGFPDLSGDGKVTKKDILMGRGVIPMEDGGVASFVPDENYFRMRFEDLQAEANAYTDLLNAALASNNKYEEALARRKLAQVTQKINNLRDQSAEFVRMQRSSPSPESTLRDLERTRQLDPMTGERVEFPFPMAPAGGIESLPAPGGTSAGSATPPTSAMSGVEMINGIPRVGPPGPFPGTTQELRYLDAEEPSMVRVPPTPGPFDRGIPAPRPVGMQMGGEPIAAQMAAQAAPAMPMDPAAMPAAPGAAQGAIDPMLLESMIQEAAGSFGSLDQALETGDYAQVMNSIRGDQVPIEGRRQELAGVVGPEDAAQTPDSVLTLVQPVMQLAAVDQGIGSMVPGMMDTPVEGNMAGGIMSTVNMADQGGPAPVNFSQGGAVQHMQSGGVAMPTPRQQELFDQQRALYGQIFGTDQQAADLAEQRKLTQAQILFDIAQGGLMFATPGERTMSPASRLAQAFTPVLGNIGARAGEFGQFKQSQRDQQRQLDLTALQRAESLYQTEQERAAALAAAEAQAERDAAAAEAAAAGAALGKIYDITIPELGESGQPLFDDDGNPLTRTYQAPLTVGNFRALQDTFGVGNFTVSEARADAAPNFKVFADLEDPTTYKILNLSNPAQLLEAEALAAQGYGEFTPDQHQRLITPGAPSIEIFFDPQNPTETLISIDTSTPEGRQKLANLAPNVLPGTLEQYIDLTGLGDDPDAPNIKVFFDPANPQETITRIDLSAPDAAEKLAALPAGVMPGTMADYVKLTGLGDEPKAAVNFYNYTTRRMESYIPGTPEYEAAVQDSNLAIGGAATAESQEAPNYALFASPNDIDTYESIDLSTDAGRARAAELTSEGYVQFTTSAWMEATKSKEPPKVDLQVFASTTDPAELKVIDLSTEEGREERAALGAEFIPVSNPSLEQLSKLTEGDVAEAEEILGGSFKGLTMTYLSDADRLKDYASGALDQRDPNEALLLTNLISSLTQPTTAWSQADGRFVTVPGQQLGPDVLEAISQRQSLGLAVPGVSPDQTLPPTPSRVGEDPDEGFTVRRPPATVTIETGVTSPRVRFDESGKIDFSEFEGQPTFIIQGEDLTKSQDWQSGVNRFFNQLAGQLTGDYGGEEGEITSKTDTQLERLANEIMRVIRSGTEGRIFALDAELLGAEVDGFRPGPLKTDRGARDAIVTTRNALASSLEKVETVLGDPTGYTQEQVTEARSLKSDLTKLIAETTAAVAIYDKFLDSDTVIRNVESDQAILTSGVPLTSTLQRLNPVEPEEVEEGVVTKEPEDVTTEPQTIEEFELPSNLFPQFRPYQMNQGSNQSFPSTQQLRLQAIQGDTSGIPGLFRR